MKRVAPSRLGVVSCLVMCLTTAAAPGGTSPELRGLELSDALQSLRGRGLSIVFSSELVHPGMRVLQEPSSTDPREQLDEILVPFGLRVQEMSGGILVVISGGEKARKKPGTITGRVRDRDTLLPVAGARVAIGRAAEKTDDLGRFVVASVSPGRHSVTASARGYVTESVRGVGLSPGSTRHLEILLSPAPFLEEKIEVFSTSDAPSREPLATTWMLGHEELDHLPQLGDPLRGLALAPGATSADLSARISVRGGRADETRIVLDGQEIYDPYHLKDYESALTIIPSLGLANASLLSAGLSAAHGDRIGGVVDLRTRGSTDPTLRVSLTTLDALAQGSGAFASERGSWLVSARRGVIDFASEVSGDERPSFWDVFGRLDLRPGTRHSIRVHALASADDVHYAVGEPGEEERLLTDYTSDSFWLTHEWILRRDVSVETSTSWSRTTRDRNGGEIQDENVFTVSDTRDLDVLGLSQQASWQVGARHLVRGGWELRDFDADFDYRNEIEPDLVIEAPFSPTRNLTTEFTDELHGRHFGGWLSDRLTLNSLVAELGIRVDDHSLPDERFWSPRVTLAWQIAPRGALLASWGVYRQSQRPYELQVEDGETSLAQAERSEQWSVGYEHSFGTAPIQSLHLELFRHEVDNPRVRFENLLEPINRFHEVEPDRVRIEPDRSRMEGIELTLRGTIAEDLGWRAAYTYSESRDVLAFGTVPRKFDQPRAATILIDYRFRTNWSFDLAWVHHAGWPTTRVLSREVAQPDGGQDIELSFGPLNGERMPDYHRLDVRLGKTWQLKTGKLRAFAEIRNVYDRQNVAGYDVSVDSGELLIEPEYWPGIVPVIGVIWEFCGQRCGVR